MGRVSKRRRRSSLARRQNRASAEDPDIEIDYIMRVDICHAGDPALGLFGEGSCPGTSDGNQDRTPGNDAEFSLDVDQEQ